MRSIFEDPGNMKALGMIKKTNVWIIHIREPATLTITDEDMFFKVKSALTRNKIKFEYNKSNN